MYRSKDFLMMEVVDIKGKKIGFIKDILIDFNKGVVTGFSISSYSLFHKSVSISKKDIISFNYKMIIKRSRKEEKLKFFPLKGIDVIDKFGNDIGIMEDIVFDNITFKINGVVVSKGLIRNFINGKKIFLIKELILGEKNILYYGEDKKMNFKTMPHDVVGKNR
ncbi:PRC-barrel domain-containing protein [Clostridium ganghwense]|uniref:PRC-barrel domain-containing protein n=1 Tax=Clostridium ganghwense TaxID=312089 RepID=A0ABT4CWP9_9CLOT|nr:PRC-barrel domain-containing protein [Clostridium ganghwense]MCY6372314.1 PRC-barrel domain-containing protein [Clostridium ganghwense]